MALTDPYDPRTPADLASAVRHVVRLSAIAPGLGAPVPLDVQSGSLKYDEFNAPFVTLDAYCRAPLTQDVLDQLDPRRGVQIVVEAGYQVPGRPEDVHEVARLSLWSRSLERPANTLRVEARSAEAQLLQWGPLGSESWTFTDVSDSGGAITQLLQGRYPAATIVETLPREKFLDAGDTLVISRGDNVWSAIGDICNRLDVEGWVYEDGQGTWYVRPRPTLAGRSALTLRTGLGGTIVSSSSDLALDDFANAVQVVYSWYTDAGPRYAYGHAQATTGPFSVAAVGRRLLVVEIAHKGTATRARAAARSILKRALSRGRSLAVESGAAAYWLRPGHTVSVQLPLGGTERHLVSSVTFDLAASGAMNLTTRLPETATIETGA